MPATLNMPGAFRVPDVSQVSSNQCLFFFFLLLFKQHIPRSRAAFSISLANTTTLTCRQADVDSFHDAHFSNAAVALFGAQFLAPDSARDDDACGHEDHGGGDEEEQEEGYYDDDGLGYYPDGVKRTLTDEQIAIFRHSEIEALRRARDRAEKATKAESGSAPTPQVLEAGGRAEEIEAGKEEEEQEEGELGGEEAGSEDGELETERPTAAELKRRKRRRARQAKRDRKKFCPEPREDLRKRTWDKVEAGMDSLDYDGLEPAPDVAPNHAAQRRRISYDD